MAGPIINMLRRFRENAPARIEARRTFIRDLINPMASIEDTDRMQNVGVFRRPVRRGGVFASLGGNQTANQAHKGREQIMPVPRQMQDDPAGPDLTPDRAYDGDGTGTPMQNTAHARPRAAKPEEPDRTYGTAAPQIVRSETIALPPPTDSDPRSGLQEPPELQAARQRAQRSSVLEDRLGPALANSTGDPGQDRTLVALLTQQGHTARAELQRQEELHRGSPEYKAWQQNKMMERAFETGDWQTFHRHISQQNMITHPKQGVMIDEESGPLIARPFVGSKTKSVFASNNTNPAQLEPLVQAIRYAYPPVMTGEGDKKMSNYAATVANIKAELSRHNIAGDPGLDAFIQRMAVVAAGRKSQYQTGK